MKSIAILLLLCALITNQTNGQSQTDVSAWLTESTINGTGLQILRAPETALNGNTRLDIMSIQRYLDKCTKLYREKKPAMLSSMEGELQFIEVQNPAWPVDYYKKEMAAFVTYNKDLEDKRQEAFALARKRYADSVQLAALTAGYAFVKQPFVWLKEKPAMAGNKLGKVYRNSYVHVDDFIDNTPYIEVTVGAKHTGYLLRSEVVETLDSLATTADTLADLKAHRSHGFTATPTYQARLNREAQAEAAELRAMNNPPKRKLIRGPQGGCYFINASGNKEYVDRGLCK